MKRTAALLLSVCICVQSASIPCSAAETAPVSVSAKACVLMDAQTGYLLFEKNASEKRPMASTTKIMTTLLTLESGGLDDPFTVDPDAIRVEGSSMGLQPGDTVSKRVLCAGMLLPSGNDAANAAAVAVAGSIPAFLARMNARAAEIGMTHTCFASPSGLDAPGHGASAHDMALLAREALRNEEFAAICRESAMTVRFGNPPYARTLYNTNKLLTRDSTVIGVKTGFTDAAGRCLVSACERGGRRLICVTLHDRSDWNDHLALYDWGFSDAAEYTVPPPESLTVPVEGGTKTALRLAPEAPLTLTKWRGVLPVYTETVRMPPFVTAPVHPGDAVGTLVYRAENGMEIAQIRLFADEEIGFSEEGKLSESEKILGKLRGFLTSFVPKA